MLSREKHTTLERRRVGSTRKATLWQSIVREWHRLHEVEDPGLGGGLAIAGYYKLVQNAAVGFIDRVVDRAAQAARSMPRLRK